MLFQPLPLSHAHRAEHRIIKADLSHRWFLLCRSEQVLRLPSFAFIASRFSWYGYSSINTLTHTVTFHQRAVQSVFILHLSFILSISRGFFCTTNGVQLRRDQITDIVAWADTTWSSIGWVTWSSVVRVHLSRSFVSLVASRSFEMEIVMSLGLSVHSAPSVVYAMTNLWSCDVSSHIRRNSEHFPAEMYIPTLQFLQCHSHCIWSMSMSRFVQSLAGPTSWWKNHNELLFDRWQGRCNLLLFFCHKDCLANNQDHMNTAHNLSPRER